MTIKATILLLGCLAASRGAAAEDSPLGLVDLEAYRSALSAPEDRSAPTVEFRDLWDRPEEYAGRIVAVEGRLARTFRQPEFAEFPPLVEAWVVSPAGDPFCLVFPPAEGRATPEIGASVRFSGTFLKRIRYHGGDVDRLAPLIVGPVAPSTRNPPSVSPGGGWSSTDWLMAVGAFGVVATILAGRHLSRPSTPRQAFEPPPSFVDGKLERAGDFA